MDMERVVRVLRVMTLVFASVLLAACGAEDNGEEDTAEAPDAQPTLEVTEEAEAATGTPPVVAAAESPTASESDEPVSDMATPTASGITGAGTPASATPEPITTFTTPEVEEAAATPDVASEATPDVGPATEADEITGDGTTGAVPDLTSTPAATGLATPATDSTPSATPGTSTAEPLSVSGCDVENVPPYTGEQSSFVVSVDVNFRVGPGTDCELAIGEPIGEFQVVEVIGGPVIREDDGSEWVQIEVLGTQGWVAFEFLEPAGE
jgi:hypothetical protein